MEHVMRRFGACAWPKLHGPSKRPPGLQREMRGEYRHYFYKGIMNRVLAFPC